MEELLNRSHAKAALGGVMSTLVSVGLVVALCPAVALAEEPSGSENGQAAQTEETAPVEVTVTFDADGGTPTPSRQTLTEGSAVKMPAAPKRSGYTFVAWSVDGKQYAPNNSSYKVADKDVTVTAVWKKDTANLKLKSTKVKKSNSLKQIAIAKKGNIAGGITYQAYNGAKWVKASNGKYTKAGSKLQAIRVKLTGGIAKKYNVYYRVKVPGYGWMAWAKNNAKAGTVGLRTYATDYQVKLVEKGDAKTVAKLKKQGKGLVSYAGKKTNLRKYAKHLLQNKAAKAKKSSTNWLIVVDTHINFTAVFKGKKKGVWQMDKLYRCVTGKPSTPTVKGNYSLGGKGYVFGHGYSCWYYSQIYADYLFHSVPYWPGSKKNIRWKAMGSNSSHGCVRLALKNAKFIHDKVPSGTRVYIY